MKDFLSFRDTETAFSLKTDEELVKLRNVFRLLNGQLPSGLGAGMVSFAVKIGLPIKGLLKTYLFDIFCGGETLEDCEDDIELLTKGGVQACLDYSVEGGSNEEGFERTTEEILSCIQFATKHEIVKFVVLKPSGISHNDILRKVSAGEALNEKEDKEFKAVQERLDRICYSACENNISVLIDAEESWYQDAVDALTRSMMEKYNKERGIVFNTFQMYRRDMPVRLESAVDNAKKGGYKLGVKIVRGAYLDKERKVAKKEGWPDPIFPTKADTDNAFNEGLRFCMDNLDHVVLLNGSHNEESNYILAEMMEEKNLKRDDSRVWFSQLYGMSDAITLNLADAGYNTAKYLPYGPLEKVIPYLMRRAQENQSVTDQSGRDLRYIETELRRRKNEN